jgi:hypothetical protein
MSTKTMDFIEAIDLVSRGECVAPVNNSTRVLYKRVIMSEEGLKDGLLIPYDMIMDGFNEAKLYEFDVRGKWVVIGKEDAFDRIRGISMR